MVYLSAQPLDLYFQWQIEVQITNFRKFNISNNMHICVWYPKHREAELKNWEKIQEKYPEVKIFYYEDSGVNLELYIPQLRPHILAKHFDKYPELKKEIIFYHDSDIIFNYLPDFQLLSQDNICWESNTSGYLDYDYLRRKEIEGKIPEDVAIKVLCDIGNISVDIMKAYTGKTGGAQYLLKGIDGNFWRDVERQVLLIRRAFSFSIPNSINRKYFSSESAGFQSWCADMWAVNMALWNRGKITDVTDKLDFSWATDTAETYLNKPIFHNAGATNQNNDLFIKSKWINRSPLNQKHDVTPSSASFYYVEAINNVK